MHVGLGGIADTTDILLMTCCEYVEDFDALFRVSVQTVYLNKLILSLI